MTGSVGKKKMKNGKYRYYPIIFLGIDILGKKKYKWYSGFDTVKAANKELRRILVEEYDDLNLKRDYLTASKLTMKGLSKQWLSHKKKRLKPSTYATYENYTKNHILPYFDKTAVLDIKPLMIQAFYDSLEETDTGRAVEGKLSPSSIKQIHHIMSGMFKYAVRMQLVSKNPALYAELPVKKAYSPKLPTPEDVVRILNYFLETDYFIPILIGSMLGLRRGEVLGLSIDSFDYENRTLKVTQALIRDTVNGGELLTTPKTKQSKRILLMNNYLRDIIQDHIESISKGKELYGSGYNELNLICINQDGNYIKPDELTKKFKKAIRTLELDDKIRLHDLRHYVATNLFREGIATKTVSGIMGHSTTGFTEDVYIEFNTDNQSDAIEVLTDKLKNSKIRSRYRDVVTSNSNLGLEED